MNEKTPPLLSSEIERNACASRHFVHPLVKPVVCPTVDERLAEIFEMQHSLIAKFDFQAFVQVLDSLDRTVSVVAGDLLQLHADQMENGFAYGHFIASHDLPLDFFKQVESASAVLCEQSAELEALQDQVYAIDQEMMPHYVRFLRGVSANA